jgi:hypothetical protein
MGMKVIRYFLGVNAILFNFLFLFSSCDDFFDVPVDKGQVIVEKVFGDDKSATAAIYGLYQGMASSSFAGGGEIGITMLTGLSSDELSNISDSPDYLRYEQNQLLGDDGYLQNLWTEAYRTIYQANDILENLESSTDVTDKVSSQLRGEVLFCRAFCYFYLVNLFDAVPLVTITDYEKNAKVSRRSAEEVYDQIIMDLQEAKALLTPLYPESERVRPNRYTAMALLARVYLYRHDWSNAKTQADSVISRSEYFLESDLSRVFVAESQEVIWQLASELDLSQVQFGQFTNPTRDGAVFNLMYGIGSSSGELTPYMMNAFIEGDYRIQNWINVYHDDASGQDFYYPYKYKITYGVLGAEHYVVLRLAEQYLIRAEANVRLDLLNDAISDLDTIRTRAGLGAIAEINPAVLKDDLLVLIMEERQRELFAEWGHRWFDLKRTDKANEVLGIRKDGWEGDDALYPIPAQEFRKNPFLGDQNDGY